MKKVIFEAIAGYLATSLNTPEMIAKYGQLKYIAVYNDQFNNEDSEHVIPKPAIAISFPSSDGWETKTNNRQVGDLIISVYIAQHTIADSNYFASELDKAESMKRFEYLQDVQNLLQGLDLGAAGKLSRVFEQEDVNADHVAVDRIDYFTSVEDCLSDPAHGLIEIEPDWRIIYKHPTDRPASEAADYKYLVHNHL